MIDLPLFWRALLRRPRQIGAIAPAGRELGAAIARALLSDGSPGIVIELGAGTGAITRALIDIRDKVHFMAAIEKDPELAHNLRTRFPELTVLTLCASEIGHLPLPQHEQLTLVSSLPFASLPALEKNRVCSSIKHISSRYRRFRLIQYSYFGRIPFASPCENLEWVKGPTIVRNLPPATVWMLNKKCRIAQPQRPSHKDGKPQIPTG